MNLYGLSDYLIFDPFLLYNFFKFHTLSVESNDPETNCFLMNKNTKPEILHIRIKTNRRNSAIMPFQRT
jgi:hypothetical protein